MIPFNEAVFGANGTLAEVLPGYAPRPGQVAMADAVAEAIEAGVHLVVEGPTGTGKSIAYLVPAIAHTQGKDCHVVVATANIALQEQLVKKDLPLLARCLSVPFTFDLLKGRTNYLCRHRHAAETEEGEDPVERTPPPDRRFVRGILSWAEETERGDVSELPTQPPPAVWERFSSTADACHRDLCAFADTCFARQAAARARACNVIVTNYHILFAHLAVKEAAERDLVLPAFDVAVMDEAHKAADIARDFFGWRLTLLGLRRLSAPLADLGAERLREDLLTTGAAWFDLAAEVHEKPEHGVRLRSAGLLPGDGLLDVLHLAACHFDSTAARLDPPRDPEEPDQGPPPDREVLQRAADCRRRAERLRVWSQRVEKANALDENEVVFVETDAQARVAVCCRPVHVADRLRKGLFEATGTVVVTSATLAVGTRSFDLVKAELGVGKPRELAVPSPFDLRKQALLVVPADFPDPSEPAWPAAVARAVSEVVGLAQGRTLGLFTSYQSLDRAWHRVRGGPYRVLRQGEAPRTALVDAFRRDVPSVLLGTESFWAGVDVPGESLSCVVIDRLPFPSPTDPVLDALRERDPAWFRNHALPRAIIAFKQGFGRLIRSVEDRGVVVVLDRRILDRPYGRLFLSSIGRLSVSRRLQDVATFLNRTGGRP